MTFQKTAPSLLLGFLLIAVLVEKHYSDNLYINLFFYLLILALFIDFILKWRKYIILPKRKGIKTETLPLKPFLGIVIIALSMGAYTYMIRNKKTLILAYSDLGLTRTYIDLKTDGSYVIEETMFLGNDFTYGRYRVKDSFIHLSNISGVGILRSKDMVIRKEIVNGYEHISFLQLNNNKTDTTLEVFTVVKDQPDNQIIR